MKKNILLIAIFSIFLVPGFCLANQVTCSRDMHAAYQKLIQLPEAKDVVSNALKRGPIRVESSNGQSCGFEGMWDSGRRAIVVSPRANRSIGEKINTMMMEFHNAQSDARLCELFRGAHEGRLGKEFYVEQVERVEHENAVNSAKLLAKGIREGIYPANAAWAVMENFDDHYKIQQILDHSKWIAANYDQINHRGPHQAYKGTVPRLYQLTSKEKSYLCHYIRLKSEMASQNRQLREHAQERFARELSRRHRGGEKSQYARQTVQDRCFDTVFGETKI